MKSWVDKQKEKYKKRKAKRQAKIRQDFLPKALEIVEKPVSHVGHFVIFFTLFIVAFLAVWSVAGKMDEVVTARGRVFAVGGVQNVQAAGTGVIEQICVREGDYVSAGQVIAVLDASPNRVALQNIEENLELLNLENELLREILDNKDIAYRLEGEEDAGRIQVISYVLAMQQEFEAQKAEADSIAEQALSQIAIEKGTLEKLVENQALLTEQKEALCRVMDYANTEELTEEKIVLLIRQKEEELKDYQELFKAGVVAKSEVDALTLDLEQLRKDYEMQKNRAVYEDYDNSIRMATLENQITLNQNDRESQETAVLMAEQKYGQALEGLNKLEADFKAGISGMIVTNEQKISSLQADYEIQEIGLEQQMIVSPVDGIVKTLEINTVGGVLAAGQTVAAIVPKDAQMIVEADIQNQDIGYVQPGQSVVMKLDTYNFQDYGKLEGTIVSISPDAVQDERKGWVYKVKIAINTASFEELNPEIKVGVGMECTAEIKIGERQIIDFFLEPLTEHFDGSLKVK